MKKQEPKSSQITEDDSCVVEIVHLDGELANVVRGELVEVAVEPEAEEEAGLGRRVGTGRGRRSTEETGSGGGGV